MMKSRYPEKTVFKPATMKNTLWLFTTLVLLSSCTKELSEETSNPNNQNPPLGSNCKVNKVTTLDSLTGEGQGSVYLLYNTAGQATLVQVFDSVNASMQFETSLQYRGDTVRVSPAEYFLLDASRRVRIFHSEQSSGGFSDTLHVQYNYDAAGYLASREIFTGNASLPVFRYAYTWRGGNMVAVDGSIAVPGVNQKILTATLEYDPNATANNFLQTFPDAFETNVFLSALDLGKTSRNVLRTMSVTLYDDQGLPEETFVNHYSNYVFSSDGYLLEWSTFTEASSAGPAQGGRARFGYHCK
jgi:hypothetical protein